jgi:hypothetical protein
VTAETTLGENRRDVLIESSFFAGGAMIGGCGEQNRKC